MQEMQETWVWSLGWEVGNGDSPQCSCLENPMDRGAWWATVGRKELDTTAHTRQIVQHPKKWVLKTPIFKGSGHEKKPSKVFEVASETGNQWDIKVWGSRSQVTKASPQKNKWYLSIAAWRSTKWGPGTLTIGGSHVGYPITSITDVIDEDSFLSCG